MEKLTKYMLNKIKKTPEKVNWGKVSIDYELSEDFIREFQDKVDWLWISICQKLSEDFVREFQDEVTWPWISEHQKLSEEFLVEFIDKVDLYDLEVNKNVPKDVFTRISLLKGFM